MKSGFHRISCGGDFMGEIVKFDSPYWKGFKLTDGKQRWMYTDEQSAIKLHNKDYFNKNTSEIIIRKGYETEENKTEPISDLMYYIGFHSCGGIIMDIDKITDIEVLRTLARQNRVKMKKDSHATDGTDYIFKQGYVYGGTRSIWCKYIF